MISLSGNSNSSLDLLTINIPEYGKTLHAPTGTNLLTLLRDNGIHVPAVCAGRGTCGKCKVVLDGKEVLACLTTLTAGCTLALPTDESSFSIMDDYEGGIAAGSGTGYAVAVDIGTTTVVMQLISLESGAVLGGASFVNGQRRWGADVISRIKASDEGELDALRAVITGDLHAALARLLTSYEIDPATVSRLVIGGNTTMLYLLLGYSCHSLGQFPFTPEFDWRSSYSFAEIFGGDLLACDVWLVPWISAFVGGDITSGIAYCKNGGGESFLLIDLGTNGEMAIYSEGKVVCTSTAAGPAFEGGNISFGTGGIKGAISAVRCDQTAGCGSGELSVETIGGEAPIGICGSGVLDVGACLVLGGFIDESGALEDDYEDGVVIARMKDGTDITFSQKDVRELQLAKSAVRAGIEILAEETGGFDKIDRVYLSGGFSRHLNVASAVEIGMIPQQLQDRVFPKGNSSLGGAVMLCGVADPGAVVAGIIENAREINLSAHAKFNDYFMDYMMFEK